MIVFDRAYELFDFANLGCPQEAVVYVHGVWIARNRDDEVKEGMFENAIKGSDRARLSLESLGYTFPVISLKWNSETALSDSGWQSAKIIAKENGSKLTQFIVDLKERCPQTTVRIIAHSLGARVVLSSLDSLNNNQIRNSNNFQITSIHLKGAVVDDDEVSKGAADVVSLDGNKSAYGEAIEEEVSEFCNQVNHQDDALEPGFINPWLWLASRYIIWNPFENQPVHYPYYEQDLAIGHSGI
ncbi:MAG: alpha/beta hydrolase [Nitrososphaeraceae archaeon]